VTKSRIDSLWLPDHLNALMPRAIATPEYLGTARLLPKIDAYLETWTMLGQFAARNRIGLRLGIGVIDAGRRNPAVTAQAAATLHLLTRGRANLDIGTGQREGNEPLASTGPSRWPGSRRRWPQIWIASHRPRMLRATGRYADGWFPAIPKAPHEYKEISGPLGGLRRRPGPMSITPAIWLFVIIGRTRDAVEETLHSDIAKRSHATSPPTSGHATARSIPSAVPCGEKCRCHC
jgi:phthiodiolone/phenolphthiodiolone dimycocerosates ketoreductase